ncbi:type II 3-dehydroquinate dehydratase [Membranicola marinus]|uniref:3-dehydroquinate dehydratase n=1 Tax=Membranihabitans marinus TaxID=1227546 RepID=A0A953I1A8_9BACT|nr:type II 3-dehydroquinate dehydratase [Membranihabitans marinus]MBY5959462.1 type II 3-dehydroquinate dehydratase [Membranihabitans marinus]
MKKNILIINGPNLNLLGTREPEIYGDVSFGTFLHNLESKIQDYARVTYYQSNSEGGIIDFIQENSSEADGLVINAGAYTHTSVAIRDALANLKIPKVEVHISNVHRRESFRHHSYLSPVCDGIIIGMGLDGYEYAVDFVLSVDPE